MDSNIAYDKIEKNGQTFFVPKTMLNEQTTPTKITTQTIVNLNDKLLIACASKKNSDALDVIKNDLCDYTATDSGRIPLEKACYHQYTSGKFCRRY